MLYKSENLNWFNANLHFYDALYPYVYMSNMFDTVVKIATDANC